MKITLLISIILLCIPSFVFAHSLAWDKNNVEPDLAGYNAYDSTTGTRAVKMNTTVIPPSVCTGTPLQCVFAIPSANHVDGHKFVVTAVDTSGNESGDSNIATLDLIPPAVPGNNNLHIINP